MKLLFDFFPLLLFFAAFKILDLYAATAVAIIASFVQVGLHYAHQQRFETMHVLSLLIIVVFGGLTLALRDDTFIKWKPTIVYWTFAALVLGTPLIAKKTALQHWLGARFALPARVWNYYNLSWAVFFLAAGSLNLYVAFVYGAALDAATRTEHWVTFKVFGLIGLTVGFTLIQALLLARSIHAQTEKKVC